MNFDEDGRKFLEPCKSPRNTLPALNKCKKEYSDLNQDAAVRIIGGWQKSGGGVLNCDCQYNGKTKSCEIVRSQLKIKKNAMQVCRKKYKSAVTRADSKIGLHGGVEVACYCGGSQLCGLISDQCRSIYGEKFTHIDSDNVCMCGSESCKDRWMGNKLEKCIVQNRDIYRGVTVKRDGTCICGNQTCDELRGKRQCRSIYGEKFTHIDSDNACMCGSESCKDRWMGNKLEKCIVQNRDIYRGVTVKRNGTCICGNQTCDELRGKRLQCLNQYGKHLRSGVETITFRKGRCYCDKNLCASLDDPISAAEPVPEGEVPPVIFVGADPKDTYVSPPSPPTPDNRQLCKKWQQKKYFGRKGRVKDRSFCSDFSSSKKDCRKAFGDIKKEIERLSKLETRREKLEKSLSEWEDKQFDSQFSADEDDGETEMGGLCIKCLTDLRRSAGPGPWQRFGSVLSIGLGAGFSALGLGEARRSQNATNQLLALQGFPAENNFGYSMAGLSLGYPLMSQGLRNLSRGSFACGPTPSPYPRPYPAYPMFY